MRIEEIEKQRLAARGMLISVKVICEPNWFLNNYGFAELIFICPDNFSVPESPSVFLHPCS